MMPRPLFQGGDLGRRAVWLGRRGSACSPLAVAPLGLVLLCLGCNTASDTGGSRVAVAATPGEGGASAESAASAASAASAQGPAAIASAGSSGPAEPSIPAGPLGAEGFRALMEPFDMAAVAENLQGAWVFSGGVNPIASAWHFDKSSFTVVNDEGEAKVGELEVIAPCKIAHVVRGGLSEVANYHTVIAADDGVYRAGSSMGLLRGEHLVVCTGHGIIVGDRSGCALWRDVGDFDPAWEKSAASCEWAEGEERRLRASSEATGELALTVYGEHLLRWTPDESRAAKAEGLDAAVAAVKAASK